jgi:hypothetical protein
MNRRNKTIEYRNRQIYAEYITHLRNGLPAMIAYAACGNTYDLSEESIRKIVAKQARGAP